MLNKGYPSWIILCFSFHYIILQKFYNKTEKKHITYSVYEIHKFSIGRQSFISSEHRNIYYWHFCGFRPAAKYQNHNMRYRAIITMQKKSIHSIHAASITLLLKKPINTIKFVTKSTNIFFLNHVTREQDRQKEKKYTIQYKLHACCANIATYGRNCMDVAKLHRFN
jgi:hypothetical protein